MEELNMLLQPYDSRITFTNKEIVRIRSIFRDTLILKTDFNAVGGGKPNLVTNIAKVVSAGKLNSNRPQMTTTSCGCANLLDEKISKILSKIGSRDDHVTAFKFLTELVEYVMSYDEDVGGHRMAADTVENQDMFDDIVHTISDDCNIENNRGVFNNENTNDDISEQASSVSSNDDWYGIDGLDKGFDLNTDIDYDIQNHDFDDMDEIFDSLCQ